VRCIPCGTHSRPSLGEWGGRAHHPGPARPLPASRARHATPESPPKRSAHAEPARSLRLEVVPPAERLLWFRLWRWGYLPPPWRSVSTARAVIRGHRATGHGRHHGVPDGGARRPCRAMHDCGATRIAYNSMPQPSLSQMPGADAGPMLADRQAELLPVPYFHSLHTAAPIGESRSNKSVVYAIPVRTAAETLATIAANPRHLGAKLGMTMVASHLGPDPAASSARPLRRSRRRALT